MAEILGPALNLHLYEKGGSFDTRALFADLAYFVREHGPSLASRCLPDAPQKLLVRLQYAPDHFRYHLVGGNLVASEDLKNGNLIDSQTRIDPSEPLRGAGAHHVLGRLRSWLSDESEHPNGQVVCWMSPKEGFSEHAYLTVGTIGRDEEDQRTCHVTAYMSDFSKEQVFLIIRDLTGISIPDSTDPKLASRMLLVAASKDVISSIRRALGPDASIEGVPISRLYGEESCVVWEKIREVVGSGQEQITAVIKDAKERVDAMAGTMAQAVFGLIRETIEGLGGNVRKLWRSTEIETRRLLDAFALAVAGCVGAEFMGGVGLPVPPVRIGAESDYVHCPNCNREVFCPLGERCPGCRQVRPC